MGEPVAVVVGGNRPRAHGALGFGVRSERAADARSLDQAPPLRGERLARRPVVRSQDTEPDVGAADSILGTHGEHPRVAGEEVLLEQDPEPPVVDAAEVLAERVPAAERRRRLRPDQVTHRRPVAVGRDHEARGHVGAAFVGWGGQRRDDGVVALLDRGHACALPHVDALRPRVRDQRGVELGAWDHSGVGAGGGQRHLDLAAGRRDEHGVGDPDPRGQRADVEADLVEQSQRPGGEAVTAGLVAREGGLVDDQGVETQPPGLESRRHTGGTGSDDEDVEIGAGQVRDGTHVSPRWPDRGKNRAHHRGEVPSR